ncbi:MAG: TIGR04282 family arsenosugar biosynthesis glycosyltransferase [Myxococcota bacterium]
MSRRILALFAKAPVPGQVKTRLATEISLESAAALYEAMLLDILDQHGAERDCARALWFTPPDARAWFERAAPAGYRLLPQRGAGLAERMAALFRCHADEGFDRIVLRGTDSPTLPLERVEQAFAALEHAELALCPDRDGGYNLIGLRSACDGLFALELSHAGVLSQTLENARALGLRAELLPAHHDVDTHADWLRLLPALDPRLTPRTLKLSRSLLPG